MDAKRLELYDLLKPKLDEEPARKLVLALHPDPDNVLTRNDLAAFAERIDARFDQLDARFDARFASVDARFASVDARFDQLDARLDARFAAVDTRFAAVDARFAAVDGGFSGIEARIAQSEAKLTLRMVTIMGAWTIAATSLFAFISQLFPTGAP